MSGIFDVFSGNLIADVLKFNPDATPAPDTLVIRMTRGERRIADELRKEFGGFERVVIDVDGEQHEFSADSLVQMLEDYEDAQGMNNHMRLFGTPERAMHTIALIGDRYPCDDGCFLMYEGKKYPAELDFGFLGMMPITITVGGFRYLVEVPNGE